MPRSSISGKQKVKTLQRKARKTVEEARANLMAKNYKSSKSCVACGQSGKDMVCEHHVYTRGAFPEHSEKLWNKMPTCLSCHVEIHKIGTTAMSKKYIGVARWLSENGWEICPYGRKWIHEHK